MPCPSTYPLIGLRFSSNDYINCDFFFLSGKKKMSWTNCNY